LGNQAGWRGATLCEPVKRCASIGGTGSGGNGVRSVYFVALIFNQSRPQEEMEKIRKAIERSRPYSSEKWVGRTVAKFGLENTLHSPGLPKGQNKRS